MISHHSAQKCTPFRCKTSQNPPFLFCSHSVINCHTHLIIRMLSDAYLMHFGNFTEYEKVEYEESTREQKKYTAVVFTTKLTHHVLSTPW